MTPISTFVEFLVVISAGIHFSATAAQQALSGVNLSGVNLNMNQDHGDQENAIREPVSSNNSPWIKLPETVFQFPFIPQTDPLRAVATFTGNSSIRGTITFDQRAVNEPITINGRIAGLSPNGEHGFHVHSFGDLTSGCNSVAGHFNPFTLLHGGPRDLLRHAGDLGNVLADGNGTALFTLTDRLLSLSGGNSILGRAVVVHERPDDLGTTGTRESKQTGNSGARLACAIIGLSPVE